MVLEIHQHYQCKPQYLKIQYLISLKCQLCLLDYLNNVVQKNIVDNQYLHYTIGMVIYYHFLIGLKNHHNLTLSFFLHRLYMIIIKIKLKLKTDIISIFNLVLIKKIKLRAGPPHSQFIISIFNLVLIKKI